MTKTMPRGDISKLLWIDSSVNTHGDRTRVHMPPGLLSASGNERISLTLMQFSMRRNWYNINESNNTFYIAWVDSTTTPGTDLIERREIKITEGLYPSFGDVATKIKSVLITALTAAGKPTTNVNCELVQSTRKFTITLPPGVVVQTFFVKNASPPPHISSGGMYQDVHEILGVSAFRSFSEANMIRTTPNGIKFPVSSMYTTVSSTAIVSIISKTLAVRCGDASDWSSTTNSKAGSWVRRWGRDGIFEVNRVSISEGIFFKRRIGRLCSWTPRWAPGVASSQTFQAPRCKSPDGV